jgi:hypothetical protein
MSHLHLMLYLVPLLLVVAPLIAGRYPGERALIARARIPRRQRRPRPAPSTRPRTPPRHLVPRGGALLAAALAGRAPPAVA